MLAVESKVPATQPVAGTRVEPPTAWKQIVEPVEPFLDGVSRRLAEQVHAFDPALVQYAEYALTGNGKQLRPTLVALAANSFGKINDSHVTVAAIIEMVHLATLVHDDVMDEAEIRRGKLTVAGDLPGGRVSDEHGLFRGDFADATSPELRVVAEGILSRARDEDGGVV